MTCSMKSDSKGFSLIEVLVAMAILAIGVVAVTKLFPQGLRASRVAQERTIAAELADSTFARVKMTGLDNLLGTMRASNLYAIDSSDLMYQGNGDRDSVITSTSTSISRASSGINDNLVRVTFSVEMPDGRRENFVTYVTQY